MNIKVQIHVHTVDTTTSIFISFSYLCHLGEIKRSTSMSFVDGNLGTWPKEKRFVMFLSCYCATFKYCTQSTR